MFKPEALIGSSASLLAQKRPFHRLKERTLGIVAIVPALHSVSEAPN